ncbi:MAG: HEPN domain-containing protein [Armatimonadota bacterium]|nr:HEPN domain-containing protein [Armatimonadota bacterium]
MPYEDLLEAGRIRRHRSTADQLIAHLDIAHTRLEDASVEGMSAEGTFLFAYDAARAAAEAVMAVEGYRAASGAGRHEIVFEFLRRAERSRWADLAVELDEAREKRNYAEYERAGLITRTEADDLLRRAREFVNEVARWLHERGIGS